MVPTTVKRFAILIAILSFVGGAGFFTLQAQVARMARNRLAEAAEAEKSGDFVTAERLYSEHMQVLPSDPDVQVKYADALLKVDNSPRRQEEAIRAYNQVLTGDRGRDEVRRKLMRLKMEMGRYVSHGAKTDGADSDLEILLGNSLPKAEAGSSASRDLLSSPDGELLFDMARCKEAADEAETAAKFYRKAIERRAPQRLEASKRLADLLREKLNRPVDADEIIDAMVKTDPENDQVYLERGRYRLSLAGDDASKRLLRKAEAIKDFEEAMKRAPHKPDSYLALAGIAVQESNFDSARKVIEKGLQNAPTAAALHLFLAGIAERTGEADKIIEILERGLSLVTALPQEEIWIRRQLAELLARRGDTGALRMEIDRMRDLGLVPWYLQYLEACYHINDKDYLKARQLLVPIQRITDRTPDLTLRTRIRELLAQCYRQLGEQDREQEALIGALSSSPDSAAALRGLIENLKRQGDLEGAIKIGRDLVAKVSPDGRSLAQLELARLLLTRNEELPAPRRDWREVNQLLDAAAAVRPEVDILRARTLRQQDQAAAAEAILAKSRSEFPGRVEIPIAQAELKTSLGQFDQALAVLEKAREASGKDKAVLEAASKASGKDKAVLEAASKASGKDKVEQAKRSRDEVLLRLEIAKLWSIKKGPDAAKTVIDQTEKLDSISRGDRHGLFIELASRLIELNDLAGASTILSRLAATEPKDLDVRRWMLDIALQTPMPDPKDADQQKTRDKLRDTIRKNIDAIKTIEGTEGLISRHGEVKFLIWQAQHETDKKTREDYRTNARNRLTELRSRRGDWSVIPQSFALLEEQELRQDRDSLTKEQIRAKEENIVELCQQAIRLGSRDATVVRRTIQLLFEHGRGSDALALLGSIPSRSQFLVDFGRQAVQIALANRDCGAAEEIARKAVDAHPEDFAERLWLSRVLRECERRDDAELELRKAIDLAPADTPRRIALVWFLLDTSQVEKAINAVRQAEEQLEKLPPAQKLPQSQKALALAECCERVGRAFEAARIENEKDKWFKDATKWYVKAHDEQPEDISIRRRLAEFLVQTNQMNEAESQLNEIRKRGSGAKDAETARWAKRQLALVYAFGSDKRRVPAALALFEPNGQPAAIGQEGTSVEDPEDLRIVARVLAQQKDIRQRKRAIAILATLANRNGNTPDDWLRLAGLHDAVGDWPKAREAYRELSLRTSNIRDAVSNRRPLYLTFFVEALLRNRQPGDAKALAEAHEIVAEIVRLQPDAWETLVLQVDTEMASDQLTNAAALVRAYADRFRDRMSLEQLRALAQLAERVGTSELAEQLYNRFADRLGPPRGNYERALFLGRRGKTAEALNLCEPLWADAGNFEHLIQVSIAVLFGGNRKPSPADLQRISGWFDRALKQAQQQNQRSTIPLVIGLGALREGQENYADAERQYKEAIKLAERNGIALSGGAVASAWNNLGWLIALREGTGGVGVALGYVDKAIALGGEKVAEYRDTRGIVHLIAHDPKSAISDLELAVESDPAPAKLYHLAQAYLLAGNKPEAKKRWETAKLKGLSKSNLHPLELKEYENVKRELESQ